MLDENDEIIIGELNEPLLFSFLIDKSLKLSNAFLINENLPETTSDVKPVETEKTMNKTTDIKNVSTDTNKDTNDDDDDFTLDDNTTEDIEDKFDSDELENWLQTYFVSHRYNIIDNEGGGDCFFSVIRDAFQHHSKKPRGFKHKDVNVMEIRNILSEEVTDELYNNYKTNYVLINDNLKQIRENIKKLNSKNIRLKGELSSAKERSEQLKIIEDAKLVKQEYNALKDEKAINEELISDFKHMQKIKNKQQYQNFIKTCNFWADTWAISTVERLLNTKIILLSEEEYEIGAENIILCGQLNDESQETIEFNPDYYIIAIYNGFHYQLVSYKNNRLFKFKNIPLKIIKMVVQKCLEKNSGPYSRIPDFMNYKLGEQTVKTKIAEYDSAVYKKPEVDSSQELFDSNVTLQFYNKSSSKKLPGLGIGEKIPKSKITNFNLSIKDNWRQKLDNDFIHSTGQEISIDDKLWKSVTHYIEANKFKKETPELYELYSISAKSPNKNTFLSTHSIPEEIANKISKDVEIAKDMGKINPTKNQTIKRPNSIQIDKDYFGSRENQVIETALTEKFNIPEFKNILSNTNNAKLVHYRVGKPVEEATLLMSIRKLNKIKE